MPTLRSTTDLSKTTIHITLLVGAAAALTLPYRDKQYYPKEKGNDGARIILSTAFTSVRQDAPNTSPITRFDLKSCEKCCHNQLTKFFIPSQPDSTEQLSTSDYIKIPLKKKSYNKYKVLVATAPSDWSKNSDDPFMIYVIFPDLAFGKTIRVPKIYFVNAKHKHTGTDVNKPETILIVNSNRTVTGIKSKEIAKYIQFKNKLRT